MNTRAFLTWARGADDVEVSFAASQPCAYDCESPEDAVYEAMAYVVLGYIGEPRGSPYVHPTKAFKELYTKTAHVPVTHKECGGVLHSVCDQRARLAKRFMHMGSLRYWASEYMTFEGVNRALAYQAALAFSWYIEPRDATTWCDVWGWPSRILDELTFPAAPRVEHVVDLKAKCSRFETLADVLYSLRNWEGTL